MTTQPFTVKVVSKDKRLYKKAYLRRVSSPSPISRDVEIGFPDDPTIQRAIGDSELDLRKQDLNEIVSFSPMEEAIISYGLLNTAVWPLGGKPIPPIAADRGGGHLSQFPHGIVIDIPDPAEIKWLVDGFWQDLRRQDLAKKGWFSPSEWPMFNLLPGSDNWPSTGKSIQPIAPNKGDSYLVQVPGGGTIGYIYNFSEMRWLVAEPEQDSRKQDLNKKAWFAPTAVAMLNRLVGSDNWPSIGKSIQPIAANKMLEVLFSVLDDQTPPPSVVPTWNGGVQVEWHRNNVDFEIEYDPQRGIEYYFFGPNEEDEGALGDDYTILNRYVKALL